MHYTAFVGLGSNLGDKKNHCKAALKLLKRYPDIRISQVSKWHESEALSLPGETQPDFVNAVARLKTGLSPYELVRVLKTIEYELGRKSCDKKWQPRIIDLDLLFYEDQIIDTPQLKIPHPELHKRLFVLKPLHELTATWRHPLLQKTITELLECFTPRVE